MRTSIQTRIRIVVAAAWLFISVFASTALPASAAVTVTSHFIWTTTPSNVSIAFSFINNGATNGDPGALLFVTSSYDPGGVCGCVTDPAPVGVVWAGGANQWTVYNADVSNMPVGAAFNVLVVQKPSSRVFVAHRDAPERHRERHGHQLHGDQRQTERSVAGHRVPPQWAVRFS